MDTTPKITPASRRNVVKSSPAENSLASQSRTANSASTTAKRKRNAEMESNLPTTPAPAKKTSGKKSTPSPEEVIDLTGSSPTSSPAKKRRSPKKNASPSEPAAERRARIFRKHPPRSFLERHLRATSQRMFVVGQSVTEIDEAPEMTFDIVGTTGNIYKTTIGKVPMCDCPDSQKGNQCKHICYVLAIVLKAPPHLQYQLAFLSSELRQIYQQSSLRVTETTPENKDGNRKAVDGDCPICFMEFEPDKEEIVWCRAACGNNIHKTCFQKWAATQRAQGVTCVYCRSPWQSDTSDLNLENLMKEGTVSQEGYINVASQMGLSGERDHSTYHQPWVIRQSYSYSRRGRGRQSYQDYY
ncbi:RING finger domain protein [Aspergillus steynii IBT 23096]|uniref:RING finger domain protein n=1 Tax=Aspergillus steynii IBT 23096 TaxID=1392250 RepID=A0A2I2GNB4_9EURO|nr:RING finger domain protein [Aspergillus steynii IBT 23096]PLB54367.1 RING finger domain protein [Aspergillus steynii IBT 23096]